MAKEILILNYPEQNPITEDGSITFWLGVALKEAPSSNVTVSRTITGSAFTTDVSSLTFTTANWMIPQKFILTGASVAGTNYTTWNELTLAATGGGYSHSVELPVPVVDSNASMYPLFAKRWLAELQIKNTYQIAAKRAEVISHFFNGNGIPTNATPDATITSYSGSMHGVDTSGLTHSSTVTKTEWNMLDGDGETVTNIVYHIITDQTPVNKLHIVAQGHGYLNDIEIINACNAAGIDVAWCGMPYLPDNTTTNAKINDSSFTGRHKQILSTGIDRVGWSGYGMYIFDKVMFLNYCDENFSYTQYSISGASGGSIPCIWNMAIDQRITKSWPVRGMSIRSFRVSDGSGIGDYEGSGTRTDITFCGPRNGAFFDSVSDIDLLMLALEGGREVHYQGDINDTQSGGNIAWGWLVVKGRLQKNAENLGGTFNATIRNNASASTHEYAAAEITTIMAEI